MRLNLEGLIPLLGGVYAGLLAYGVIQGSKNPQRMDVWRKKWGKPLKVIAPLVVLFGVAMLLGVFG